MSSPQVARTTDPDCWCRCPAMQHEPGSPLGRCTGHFTGACVCLGYRPNASGVPYPFRDLQLDENEVTALFQFLDFNLMGNIHTFRDEDYIAVERILDRLRSMFLEIHGPSA